MKNNTDNNTTSTEMVAIQPKIELSIEEVRKIVSLLGTGLTIQQIEALYQNSEFL